MLIEVHMLKNFAPTNLNRDESGMPKSCMFGGVKRGRISSQCLKHSWRTSKYLSNALGEDSFGIRTRKLPDIIYEKLADKNIDEKVLEYIKNMLTAIGKKDEKPTDDNRTKQIIMYSPADIDAIVEYILKEIENKNLAEIKKTIKADTVQKELKDNLKRPITLDIALFGRMVTSDAFADVEASMQVAHAISTNKIMMETDFFTAVDDLIDGTEETGSAMMGDIDYNSSCYYIYASIDTNLLLENLSFNDNAKEYIKEVLPKLIEAMAFTNPSGKQNSFAGHSLPSAVLVEVKEGYIPVSYANAFEVPARASMNEGLVENSIRKLVYECEKIDKAYAIPVEKRLWFSMIDNIEITAGNTQKCSSFKELIENIL